MPGLAEFQQKAFAGLRYGPATKTLLQVDRPSWRRRRKPRAYATDLELGASWDAGEHQLGRKGMLAVFSGGRASAASQSLLRHGGVTELVARLRFFGVGRVRVIPSRSVSWENDPWARGAYAVFILLSRLLTGACWQIP